MARKIDEQLGMDLARKAAQDDGSLSPHEQKTVARFFLEEMAARHPGHSVEIRIPYAGAVQAITGPKHRRGTPPNVVELSATTWIALCVGNSSWSDEVDAGNVDASGTRADLAEYLPLVKVR